MVGSHLQLRMLFFVRELVGSSAEAATSRVLTLLVVRHVKKERAKMIAG